MLVDFGFIPKKIDLAKQADLSALKETAARLK